MIGKVGAAVGGAGLALAASAGKGFLEGAIGKTAAGGFTSGLKRARSGARGSPKTTGLTGDSERDTVIASRDLQSDVADQKQILKSISQEAAATRETMAEVGMWIVKNDLLLTKILDKLPNQFERNIDNIVKGALTAAGVIGAGGAAAAAARAAAPRVMPRFAGVGGAAGVVGGLGLNYAADMAGDAGYNNVSGVLGTGSYAAGGAGIGGMVGGAKGALIGGAVGGLYGLYQNAGKFGGSTNATNFNSSKEIVFKADKITFQVKSMPTSGSMIGGGFIPTGAGFSGEGLTPGVAATGSAAEAIQFFQSRGWTREQAAGIAANIKAESNFKTNAVGDGGKAYGIAQWHPDRQKNFYKVFGKDIRQSTFQEQLAFIDWELRNTESRAGNSLRAASTAAEAAAIVQNQYERPANKDPRYRASIAMGFAGEGTGAMAARTTPMGTGPAGAGGSIRPQSQMGGMTGQNGRLDLSSLTPIGSGHRLESSSAAAYNQMVEAARKDGIVWGITDSYRTYDAQVRVAREKGLYSQGGLAAYPGTSNHGWGRAVDLKLDARSSRWLQENAGRFGFRTIGREPWHWEYRGSGGDFQTASGGAPAGAGGSIRPQSGGYGNIPAPGAMPVSGIGLPPGISLGMIGGRVSPAAGRILATGGSVDYQSNGKPLINPDGSINWGDPDNAADFFRADKAMMAMRTQSAAPASRAPAKKQPKAAAKRDLRGKAGTEQFGPFMPEKLEDLSGGADIAGGGAMFSGAMAAPVKGEQFGPFLPMENLSGNYDILGNYIGGDAAPVKGEQFGPFLSEKPLKSLSGNYDAMGNFLGGGGGDTEFGDLNSGTPMDAELVGGVKGFNAQDFTKAYRLQRAPDTGSSAALGFGDGGADLNRVTDPQALQRMSEAHSNYMREQFEKQTGSAAAAVGEADKPWSPDASNKSEPDKPSGPPAGEYLRDLFGDSSYTFGAGA